MRAGVAALIALIVLSAPALASGPEPIVVQYLIHQYPADSNSPVLMEAALELNPLVQMGDTVVWGLARVSLHEPDQHGGEGLTWIDEHPDVAGQIWIVNHADPDHPVNSEFMQLPVISGFATPVSGSTGQMEYWLGGIFNVLPDGEPGGSLLVSLRYKFKRWQWLIQEDDGGPVQVPPVFAPPFNPID